MTLSRPFNLQLKTINIKGTNEAVIYDNTNRNVDQIVPCIFFFMLLDGLSSL